MSDVGLTSILTDNRGLSLLGTTDSESSLSSVDDQPSPQGSRTDRLPKKRVADVQRRVLNQNALKLFHDSAHSSKKRGQNLSALEDIQASVRRPVPRFQFIHKIVKAADACQVLREESWREDLIARWCILYYPPGGHSILLENVRCVAHIAGSFSERSDKGRYDCLQLFVV